MTARAIVGFRGGAGSSPGGAVVNSQGREPLECGKCGAKDFKTRRGDSINIICVMIWGDCSVQGLTPLAIDRRPTGAFKK